jgi:tetratricopeptide (TPR) repeat protein
VLDSYKQLAAILDRQGKALEAEEIICKALISAPDDAKIFYALIQRQVENRHLDGALDTCEQFFNAYPRNMRALAFKAFVLNERGEGMAARQLLDFDHLIQCDLLQDAPGYAAIEELNADLVEFALSHSTLDFEPAQKSTKQGSQTASLQGETAKPIATLRQLIEHNINEYFETHSGHAPHPYLDSMPAEFSLDIWATVLNPKGHQKPHFHPGGWLSGVYYPALPSAMHNNDNATAGHIEFGRPQDQYDFKAKPLIHTIQPEVGLMVLFPSYFYHRTIPVVYSPDRGDTDDTDDTDVRISIAFDVRADVRANSS